MESRGGSTRDRQGADRIAETIAVARSSPQPGRVLINIGRGGILPEGDTMDLARADVGAARDAIAKNREFIVGVKARLSRGCRGRERLRGASARPGSRHVVRYASDDPHGADGLAASKAFRAPEARRHRHAHVCAAAEQHRGRERPRSARSARGQTPRRLVRSRKRTERTHQVGHRRRDHESRVSGPIRSRPTGTRTAALRG